jgi:hypothetical protein
LYFTAQHCTALHSTALHCTALHSTAPHCTAQHCTALHSTALHCTALHCISLRCTALHCIALFFFSFLFLSFSFSYLFPPLTPSLPPPLPLIPPLLFSPQQLVRYTVCGNALVLVIVILSVTVDSQSNTWYDADLLILALSMIGVAVLTMVIAIRTSWHIQSSTMFEAARVTTDETRTLSTATSSIAAATSCCALLTCGVSQWLYELFFKPAGMHGLQMQREVVKTIILVSVICFVCFILQGASFMYEPLGGVQNGVITYMYPWTFYIIPEFFPSMAICVGIAPPVSVLVSEQFALCTCFCLLYGSIIRLYTFLSPVCFAFPSVWP